jgi:hypothetical protein
MSVRRGQEMRSDVGMSSSGFSDESPPDLNAAHPLTFIMLLY